MVSSRTRKASKVFIDSSVLIAAAISERGAARDLLRLGFRGRLDLYTAPEVLVETERNLALKAPEALSSFYIFRDLLAAKLVNPPRALVLEASGVVAAKDAPVVAAASHAAVDYVATYDRKHLLSHKDMIRTRFGVVVVTPDEVIGAAR